MNRQTDIYKQWENIFMQSNRVEHLVTVEFKDGRTARYPRDSVEMFKGEKAVAVIYDTDTGELIDF